MQIGLRETTPGFISVWKTGQNPQFCGYVSKPGVVRDVPYRAYALAAGMQIAGDFADVRTAIRAVLATATN